ncbi:hypothetical protein U27_06369 [Candidatus Vecturithrix granuli]|uniref:Uncharacterized protein n=1 Tax=Vecturithrix granuli TaxID=1499967 RepID=A0A081C480_VECG1|nr:hypothetical protein U27_06369 [Candidatus Vecturithrix granuli]
MGNNKGGAIGQRVQQSDGYFKFFLKGETHFQARFTQTEIHVKPSHLNGMPMNLAVTYIVKIERVNDPGWMVSRKLKHFLFELQDGTQIAGIPDSEILSVQLPYLEQCHIELENILSIEKIAA